MWRRRAVRAVTVAVVILATILIQYRLANRSQPIDLPGNQVTVPEIFGGQKLHLESVVDKAELALNHVGRSSEEVDVHFSKARLSPATLADYEDAHPPTASAEIHCIPTSWVDQPQTKPQKGKATGNEVLAKAKSCRTSITLAPVSAKLSSIELNFFQTDAIGRDKYRHLVTEIVNSETSVKLKLVPDAKPASPPTDSHPVDSNVDCARYLMIGDWKTRIGDATQIEMIMDPDSNLRTRFTQTNSDLWSGVDGYFEPFTLQSHQPGTNTLTPLVVRTVIIQSLDGKQILFSATSANNTTLSVNNLKVGTDRLQVALSGSAFVTMNGQTVTESVFTRLEKYPLIAAALAALNLAIFTWCVRVLKNLF